MRKTYEVTRVYRCEASSKAEARAILAHPESVTLLAFESMLEFPTEREPVALSFAKEAFRQLTGRGHASTPPKQEPSRQR
jgi:hypothetical protein